jgi:hypothetical protein
MCICAVGSCSDMVIADITVSMVAKDLLDDPGMVVRFSEVTRHASFLQIFQNNSETHPASSLMATGCAVPRDKAAGALF